MDGMAGRGSPKSGTSSRTRRGGQQDEVDVPSSIVKKCLFSPIMEMEQEQKRKEGCRRQPPPVVETPTKPVVPIPFIEFGSSDEEGGEGKVKVKTTATTATTKAKGSVKAAPTTTKPNTISPIPGPCNKPPSKATRQKLDIPVVFNNLKGHYFTQRRQVSAVRRDPWERVRSKAQELRTSGSSKQKVQDSSVTSSSSHTSSTGVDTTLSSAFYKARKNMLDLLNRYQEGQPITLRNLDGTLQVYKLETSERDWVKNSKPNKENVGSSSSKRAGSSRSKAQGPIPGGSSDLSSFTRLLSFNMDADPFAFWDDVRGVIERWEQLRKVKNLKTKGMEPTLPSPRLLSPEEVEKRLKMKPGSLVNFDLFDMKKFLPIYRNLYCRTAFPGLLKGAALSSWQKGNVREAIYYLSLSHGTQLRSEVYDRHLMYLCRDEEFRQKSSANSAKEKLKKDVFMQQINDITSFDSSLEAFEENLNAFHPDWNIVQLTTVFPGLQPHPYNRLSKPRKTPSLFLSAFQVIPGSEKRASFLAYVKAAPHDPGLSKLTLFEQFAQIMHENRAINDKYGGDRKTYWTQRENHNERLKTVMAAMEEIWLSPWAFLLPGKLQSADLRRKIELLIRSSEIALKTKFTSGQSLALYKLIENFRVLGKGIQQVVEKVLSFILDIPESKLVLISKKISDFGLAIDPSAPRYPTILILDQEIQHLPWDWLECLRTTSVTRVMSLGMTYTLMKLRNCSLKVVDPASCTFVLNPDSTLGRVQERLESYFRSRETWEGIVARKPKLAEIEKILEEKDIFLYCGHGSGQSYYPEFHMHKLCVKATPLLMGCGSAQFKNNGPNSYFSSVVNTYFLAGCQSVVGFLWEVTDVDCDRVTVDFMERWLPGPAQPPAFSAFDNTKVRKKEACLATALRHSRSSATMFLTEAAVVNYGLPICTGKVTGHPKTTP